MHYDPRTDDVKAAPFGLAHDPFKALVAPRPIGWISTLSTDGVANLAPYSYFNAVSDKPYVVLFASIGRKHSQINAEATGEFVCSLATYALREAVNTSSAPAPAGKSEFDLAGLETAPSVAVKPPRVKASPVALECVTIRTIAITDANGTVSDSSLVMGEVIHIHIDESLIHDGVVDLAKAEPIARCGYMDYAHVTSLFAMDRPSKV